MRRPATKYPVIKYTTLAVVIVCCLFVRAGAQTPTTKAVGTVKSVNGNSVVLSADDHAELTLTFADSARIIRAASGQTDLKSAPSISVSDIQVGDRVYARGQGGEGGAFIASSAIVMKPSDIAERQQREREEWRKGVGGIVKQIDVAGNTVTIANALAASNKPIVVHITPDTAIRRYSPDSVKFDDSKPSSLGQIKLGDQLYARGTKNADGTELNAQAIVSGTFREIAGTVVSTDATGNSLTVLDLATKKPVTIKVGPDSQLRILSPRMAQRIAFKLKGGSPGIEGENASASRREPGTGERNGNAAQSGQPNWRGAGRAGAQKGSAEVNWGAGDGPSDFQQMLNRMPAVSVSDLNKGDAVILVATEGSSSSGPTAITLVAGVEPLLSAAPAGTSAATILSPWNLSAPAGAGGDASTQ
jgi:hypothetical protein